MVAAIVTDPARQAAMLSDEVSPHLHHLQVAWPAGRQPGMCRLAQPPLWGYILV